METTYYNITNNCISITDSYLITDKDRMNKVLNEIREVASMQNKSYDILKRTNDNMINEWVSHNRCYNLHIFRSHTKDVDLEYPQNWIYKVAYYICSRF